VTDLAAWLMARADTIRAQLPGVRALDVELWEGGVDVKLTRGDARFGLRFMPRHESSSWASTRSTSIAVDLGGASRLPDGAEPMLRALVRLVERLDDGQLVVPRAEVAPPAGPPAERDGAVEVTPARHLAWIGLACVADTCAMTRSWGLEGAVIARLDGRLDDAAWDAWLDELAAAAPQVLHVDARVGTTPERLVHTVSRACASGVVALRVALGPASPGGAPLARVAATGRVEAWIVEAHAPVPPPGAVVLHLGVVGGAEVPSPALWIPPPAADLDAVDRALETRHDVAVAGLPPCVAPHLIHAREPAIEADLFPDGTVHTPACGACVRRPTCPGIDRRSWVAFGMRGVLPEVP
jgi:hypothetical protein